MISLNVIPDVFPKFICVAGSDSCIGADARRGRLSISKYNKTISDFLRPWLQGNLQQTLFLSLGSDLRGLLLLVPGAPIADYVQVSPNSNWCSIFFPHTSSFTISILSFHCFLIFFLVYRKDCFTTNYFKGCVEALQLSDELETIKRYIQVVNGAAPDDN